jgi:putative ABC transport system permease protein
LDNAIVVQRGSNSELTSGIDRGKASVFMVDERVARGADGQPLASGEILIVANLKRKADGADVNVSVRGVTTKALEVRGGIQVVKGQPFTPGLDEVIVGERAADRFGLELGSFVKIQKRDWKIAGIFTSEGSGFESEIWGDLNVMAGPMRREGGYQVVVVRLADPASLDAFK